MQWRTAVVTSGAVLGAAAAFNASAKAAAHALTNRIGGEEGRWRWRGHEVAWTRRGEGPAVLLLHSIHAAASSLEWRRVVEPLARTHTVWTLDLLGFGRSARPDVAYSPALYMSLIGDFATMVVGAPVALVASSLTAAYAITLAARDPRRYPALVVVGPTGLNRLAKRPGGASPLAALLRSPLFGTTLFNALATKRSIRHYLERCYADDALVTDELVQLHYDTAHQPGARFAPAAFLGQRLNHDVSADVRRLAQPTLLVWGERAAQVPVEESLSFRAARPSLPVHIVAKAGDLPHDERPAEFAQVVGEFLDRSLGGGGETRERRAGAA